MTTTVFHHIHGKGQATLLSKGDYRAEFQNGKVFPVVNGRLFDQWLIGTAQKPVEVRKQMLLDFFAANGIEYRFGGHSTTNGSSYYYIIGDHVEGLKIRVSDHSIGDRRLTTEMDYAGFDAQNEDILKVWNFINR
jgi:hypothetical protein